MRDGSDGDQFTFDNKEHTERKALHDGSPEFPRHKREAQGRLFDRCEGDAERIAEFKAEPCPFTLLPECRLQGVDLSLRPDLQ